MFSGVKLEAAVDTSLCIRNSKIHEEPDPIDNWSCYGELVAHSSRLLDML